MTTMGVEQAPAVTTDEQATGAVTPAMADPQPLGWGRDAWLNAWTAVGGLAGAVAFFYLVGGTLEALRLHHAGLPVEESIAVVPKGTLLALAADQLVVPALIQGAAIIMISLYFQYHLERGQTPWAVLKLAEWKHARELKKAAKAEAQKVQAKARADEPAPPSRWKESRVRWALQKMLETRLGRALARLLTATVVEPVKWLWRRAIRPALVGYLKMPYKQLFLWILLYMFFLPWTVSTVTFLAFFALQIQLQSAVFRLNNEKRISGRVEAVLAACAVAGVVGVRALVLEVVTPGPLPVAAVQIEGRSTPLRGVYIATTMEAVYVGYDKHLIVLPSHRVEQVNVTRPSEAKAEEAQTLIERIAE